MVLYIIIVIGALKTSHGNNNALSVWTYFHFVAGELSKNVQ